MVAYKGFDKDLSCTVGRNKFQYRVHAVNKTDHANCVKNGFHCALDPLDCLRYYPDWNNAVYYIVHTGGDTHEDGSDTKISCTELILVKKLDLYSFVAHSLLYMSHYPYREWNSRVKREKGSAFEHFCIVRGKNPIAKGKMGTILGFAKEDEKDDDIIEMGVYLVDGIQIKPNVYYDVRGLEHKGV